METQNIARRTAYKTKISWKSPSNLAIIKYWGKYGTQFPKNPSISFTLNNAYTISTISYVKKAMSSDEVHLEFLFEGKENSLFKTKLLKFLESIKNHFSFLTDYDLEIESENSFPHSSGIASSASSMSAIALCLCSMERDIKGTLKSDEEFFKKASYIARLGSGSASRSVYPSLAFWGASEHLEESSNEYAIPYTKTVNPVFLSFHDDILIVSKKEKSVSSTAGHKLMEGNVFASARYKQANNRMQSLLKAMKDGDLETFGKICEDEALTLHALMMCSDPSYILIEPQTLSLIKEIRNYREETGHPVYFSLDAGPNIHLLYPNKIAKDIQRWKENVLNGFCLEILKDFVGQGPVKMKT